NPAAMQPWAGDGAAITTNGASAFMTGRLEIPMGSADPALNIITLDLFGGLISNFLIDTPGADSIIPAYRAADFRSGGGPLYAAGDVLNGNGARRAMQVSVSAPLAVDFLYAYDRDTGGRAIVAMENVCGQTLAGVADPASPPPGFGANDGYLVKTNKAGVSGCRESKPDFSPREYPIDRYPLNPDASPLPPAIEWPLTFTDIPTKNEAHCFNALCEPCLADWNGDGVVNTIDVLGFLNDWAASDPEADVNGDGVVNTLDVIGFLNAWTSGC
ncbi:MAG TPA: GC-type dockerin domain-anchored protein, partial [Phycisphaerales bacterium]|nr:GC-type dockerin domain-anchored protein [Phycisphaerales bacterium]